MVSNFDLHLRGTCPVFQNNLIKLVLNYLTIQKSEDGTFLEINIKLVKIFLVKCHSSQHTSILFYRAKINIPCLWWCPVTLKQRLQSVVMYCRSQSYELFTSVNSEIICLSFVAAQFLTQLQVLFLQSVKLEDLHPKKKKKKNFLGEAESIMVKTTLIQTIICAIKISLN